MDQQPYQNQPPHQEQPYQQGYIPPSPQAYSEYQRAYKQSTIQQQTPGSYQPMNHTVNQKRGLLSRRGLIGVIGCCVALLGFLLPYYGTYSGYFLADVYSIYWLDAVFAVAALALLAARRALPMARNRRWTLSLLAISIVSIGFHYLLVTRDSVLFYWGLGAWIYWLGMVIVAISGLFLLV